MTKETLPKSIVAALPSSVKVADHLNKIDNLLLSVAAEFEGATGEQVDAAARAFVALHRLNDKIDATKKRFAEIFEKAKKETIPQLFDDHGIPHVALSEGFRVGTSSKLYVSIREDQREAAYKWLRKNKLGNLIIETVNASTLSAAAREMQENNLELPDMFTKADILTTSVTKSAVKK